MKSKIVIGFLSLLIIGYISLRALIYFFDGVDYDISSSKRSPDGRHLITEIQSMSEGSHAPYGQHLVFSWRPVNTPDKGYVIFAGYCDDLTYSWISDIEITISCSGSGEQKVRSRAVNAYGIQINYE